MGADLKDEWSFQDIGVMPGATIRIAEKEEKRPRLYAHCSFNNDKVNLPCMAANFTHKVAICYSFCSQTTLNTAENIKFMVYCSF